MENSKLSPVLRCEHHGTFSLASSKPEGGKKNESLWPNIRIVLEVFSHGTAAGMSAVEIYKEWLDKDQDMESTNDQTQQQHYSLLSKPWAVS